MLARAIRIMYMVEEDFFFFHSLLGRLAGALTGDKEKVVLDKYECHEVLVGREGAPRSFSLDLML